MMEALNSSSVNGAIELELMPETGSFNLNITVSHGPNQQQVVVPANSTFGDLKSVISQKIGLSPETYKLLFRGKEKEDGDHLQAAGVKDGSKVLVIEDTTPVQKVPEKVETVAVSPRKVETVSVSPEKVELAVVSRGDAAVAEVREEVDKLADQVLALQAVVEGGTKVDDRDFLYLTEMLMRQLLKLDGIEAEGEGRLKRKMEVRRVQSFVDTVDTLKSRNADYDIKNNAITASVATQSETFEPSSESESTESTEPSSTASFPSSHVAPTPASASVMSSTSTPVPVPIPGSIHVPSSPPSHL